jgi:hypothetical protein
MNDPLEYVRQLAECARQEEPPRGHVLPAALARLRLVKAPPLERPWSVFAAGAFALAAVAAFSLVSHYGNAGQDPILALFRVASINL